MNKGEDFTIKVFLHALKIDGSKLEKTNSIQYLIRRKEYVKNIINFCNKCKLRGNYVQKELDLVVELNSIKDRRLARDYSVMSEFFKKVYDVSTESPKGRERTPKTIDEALKKLAEWLL